jgi:hypothetical protein
MIAVTAPDDIAAVESSAAAAGITTWRMGEVRTGSRRVLFAD